MALLTPKFATAAPLSAVGFSSSFPFGHPAFFQEHLGVRDYYALASGKPPVWNPSVQFWTLKGSRGSEAVSSAMASGSGNQNRAAGPHGTTDFSIDGILGLGDRKREGSGAEQPSTSTDSEQEHKESEVENESDCKTGDGAGGDDTSPLHLQSSPSTSLQEHDPVGSKEDPINRFSWLQCTRYKPPRLPRVKKKDGAKKRKLGRNPRVPFSATQVAMLEQKFRHTHYLSSVDVADLSAALNLSENRVKIWFQNRRARERRDRDNVEKSAVPGMRPNNPNQTQSVNSPSDFSKSVKEGTSAFTPVQYKL